MGGHRICHAEIYPREYMSGRPRALKYAGHRISHGLSESADSLAVSGFVEIGPRIIKNATAKIKRIISRALLWVCWARLEFLTLSRRLVRVMMLVRADRDRAAALRDGALHVLELHRSVVDREAVAERGV